MRVQLIDAETGNHLRAERFDKLLADLFDMQDEIVARLANALNGQLLAAEARRAEQAAGRSRPTETIRQHIFGWPPPSRGLVDSARRIPHSRPVSRLNPNFTVARARASWTAMSDDPTYLAQLEPIFDGLRKAGMPEQ